MGNRWVLPSALLASLLRVEPAYRKLALNSLVVPRAVQNGATGQPKQSQHESYASKMWIVGPKVAPLVGHLA